jgi:hypothetical protein
MTSGIVQEPVKCSTAKEFLDALNPNGQYFMDEKLNSEWLYRGQGLDWPLVPAIFRKPGKLEKLTRQKIDRRAEIRKVEMDILVRCFEIADKRGLVIPDDSQVLRSFLKDLKSDKGIRENWIDGDDKSMDKILSFVALVQHFGIPTRLLDWTHQAYIAAFFAAEGALRENERELNGQLVVWALNCTHVETQGGFPRLPIRIVTAPGATNPNLKAQQGLFTYARIGFLVDPDEPYMALDKFLEYLEQDMSGSYERDVINGYKLRKFSLPITEAKNLLYLLAKLDITPSVVYPGYDSIIFDLEIENYWA